MSAIRILRRSVLATGAAVATAAIATQILAGPASPTAIRLRSTPTDTSAGQTSTRVVYSNPTNDAGAAYRGSLAIELAPYQNELGAVITPHSTMEAFLTASVRDVDATWTRLFKGWGFNEPTVKYYFASPGETFQWCGEETNDRTFAYCLTDDTIVVNQAVAVDYWEGRNGGRSQSGTGDMTIALFVAHEYGHNLTDELGYWKSTSDKQKEQGADCLAGVWAKDAADRGILEEGDLHEAFQGLAMVADTEAGHAHGTVEERQEAFSVGYKNGTATCVTTYFR